MTAAAPKSWLAQMGWGSGLVDREAPLLGCEPSVRVLALRLLRTSLARDDLTIGFRALFEGQTVAQDAGLGRLLVLLHELVNDVLPALADSISVECEHRSEWSRAPRGGRLDPVSTLRRTWPRTASPFPDEWLLKTTETIVDTPVNRLLAILLRRLESNLRDWLQSDASARLLEEERALLASVLGRLLRFLEHSPLGRLQIREEATPVLRREARRRTSHYRRVERIVRWFDDLAEQRLETLFVGEALGTTDSCYELIAAMSLLVVLVDRFGKPRSHWQFAETSGWTLDLQLGARVTRRGRPVTALVRARRDGAERVLRIEARNIGGDAALETLDSLEQWVAATGHEAFLLTPSPLEVDDSGVRWQSFLSPADHERWDPFAQWRAILNEALDAPKQSSPEAT
ncbi:MAG: hypothetical protein HOW73_17080 [Polyangiaceae bacterium]|nr:hypothetical protein [Polyangiaceae bacterium]